MNNEQNPQITINDLALAKNLVSIACERGAFRAEEMTTVGTFYDKLTAFLEHVVTTAETANKEKEND